jgi:hypothetical protein
MSKLEIIGPQDRPPLRHWIPLSVQHVFAMFGATRLVPLLTGLDPATALFTAGTGTLIYIVLTGAKVPAFLGSSFAFIPALQSINAAYGMPYALGGAVAAGGAVGANGEEGGSGGEGGAGCESGSSDGANPADGVAVGVRLGDGAGVAVGVGNGERGGVAAGVRAAVAVGERVPVACGVRERERVGDAVFTREAVGDGLFEAVGRTQSLARYALMANEGVVLKGEQSFAMACDAGKPALKTHPTK